MDSTHFEQDVLARSEEVPVVVDFWAPWCGPCQYLGPVIEQLAEEAEGKWELRKVNTDQYPELSERYQIRGIPAVKMIYQREVIAEFGGALPRHQIEAWLDKHLPSKEGEELRQLQETLRKDPSAENLIALETFVQTHPQMEEGKVALAEHNVFTNPERALELVQGIRKSELAERSEDIRTLAELMQHQPTGETAVENFLQQAQEALTGTDFDAAFAALIEATMEDKEYAKELPRRATIALFRYLGNAHELTKKYRRRFDMVLY